jgi:hypothetical protein
VLRRRRSGCRPRRRAPRAGRALSDFGDVSTVSVLRDVVKDGQGRTRSLERPRRQCGGARFRHLSRHALPMGSPWRESAVATPTRRAVDGSPGQGSAGRFFAGCQLSRRLLATYLDRAQPGCPHCTVTTTSRPSTPSTSPSLGVVSRDPDRRRAVPDPDARDIAADIRTGHDVGLGGPRQHGAGEEGGSGDSDSAPEGCEA